MLERDSAAGGPVAPAPAAGPTALESRVLILFLLMDLLARRACCSQLTSTAEVRGLLVLLCAYFTQHRPKIYCWTYCVEYPATMIYVCVYNIQYSMPVDLRYAARSPVYGV